MNFAGFISQKNKEIFNSLIFLIFNHKVLLFHEMETKRQSKERQNR